jgi:hypothetical protein
MVWPTITSMTWLNARDVLPGEASHFTPWLAENIDLLASAVGLAELSVVDTEVAVQEKRLDILASGIDGDGNEIPVIIENQYGVTDHRHLGQIITYLAQQQHGLAIWIAEDFSQAHLAAVEFLNRTSIEGVGYLLVRVRFTHALDGYQIHFEVLSRPNSFLKSGSGGIGSSKANPSKVAFMAAVLESIKAPLEAAGLKGVRMHTRGSYIQARLPPAAGLEPVGGHLVFRVTAKDATVLMVIHGLDTREENLAALEVVEERYSSAIGALLPTPVAQWTGGTGEALRAYASSTLPDHGYGAGDPAAAAAWAQSMFLAWANMLTSDPIADIEATAAAKAASVDHDLELGAEGP